jgi:hypothetical protein
VPRPVLGWLQEAVLAHLVEDIIEIPYERRHLLHPVVVFGTVRVAVLGALMLRLDVLHADRTAAMMAPHMGLRRVGDITMRRMAIRLYAHG